MSLNVTNIVDGDFEVREPFERYHAFALKDLQLGIIRASY